jgi:hypothetical protein
MKSITALIVASLLQSASAFAPSLLTPTNLESGLKTSAVSTSSSSSSSSSALNMAKGDSALNRFSRASRSAGVDDRVVPLRRPLGLVLAEDDNGNVFVETVAPKGNAARTGVIKEGDIVTMCSATFGDQMWSTRGVGLTRVLAAIRVRAGPTVSLVFESSRETATKARNSSKAVAAAEEARLRAQDKKDQLLKELESDEKKLKKGKFLGLF